MEKPQQPLSVFEYLKSPWYQKERDGKLSDFIEKRCFDNEATALFRGMDGFNLLKNNRLLISDITSIRVMWNIGRGDEYYYVVENDGELMLAGITTTGSHDGNPGLHKPEDILEKRKEGGVKAGETMNFELHDPSIEAVKELRKNGN